MTTAYDSRGLGLLVILFILSFGFIAWIRDFNLILDKRVKLVKKAYSLMETGFYALVCSALLSTLTLAALNSETIYNKFKTTHVATEIYELQPFSEDVYLITDNLHMYRYGTTTVIKTCFNGEIHTIEMKDAKIKFNSDEALIEVQYYTLDNDVLNWLLPFKATRKYIIYTPQTYLLGDN